MRILNVRLENYRTHESLELTMDQGITLIHGPNESGKSTVAEAVHNCLFLKPRGASALISSMQRTGCSDPPVVELQLEIAGEHYTLTKKFGASGSTTLSQAGAQPLTSNDADARLAELLHVDGTISGKGAESQLMSRWAHLWIWQGLSSNSPAEAVSEQQQKLRNKLQSISGQDLMVSDTDNAVITRLQEVCDESLTSTGRIKVGSKVEKLQQARDQWAAKVENCQETVNHLTLAANALTSANQDLKRHSDRQSGARSELKQVEAKLQQVQDVRAGLKEKREQREVIETQLTAARSGDLSIRTLEKKQAAAKAQVTPHQSTLDDYQIALTAAREALGQSDESAHNSRVAVESARMAAEAHEAHFHLQRCTAELGALKEKQQHITTLNQKRKCAADTAAKLASFTPQSVKALREAERAADAAQTRLEATAMKIEVLAAQQPVAIDGHSLQPGASTTLDEPGTLTVGDGTTIRLTPGGADNLESAKKQARDTKDRLAALLAKLGVADVAEAENLEQQRTGAESERDAIAAQIHALDPATVARRVDEQDAEVTRLITLRDQLARTLGDIAFEDSQQAARMAVESAKERWQSLHEDAQKAIKARDHHQSQINRLIELIETARASYQSAADAARDLETRIGVLVEQLGGAEQRSERMAELEGRLDVARKAEQAQEHTLAQLAPAQLETDHRRLQQTLENTAHAIDDANRRAIEARAQLERAGSSDPNRELAEAHAELDRTSAQLEAEELHLNARKFLLDRLKAAQRETSEALAKPLEDATSELLEHLYGSGSKVQIRWNDNASEIGSIQIDRSAHGLGVYPFEKLSHGTREQVALALRLAMAKVLAQDHHGSLPIVLDDAFTHADRERIQKLQTVLFSGVESGLQIILLSCHPENYTGLAQKEVALGG